jgi:hypothetical protein
MSDLFPPKLNTGLIQKRGREILLKLKEGMERSQTVLISEDSRKVILKRAKSLVDGDRSGLSGAEKGVLLQYVKDGITGDVDPDHRLSLLANSDTNAPETSSTFSRPTGMAWLVLAMMPYSSRTPAQTFVGTTVLLLLLGWVLLLWGWYILTCIRFGGLANTQILVYVVVWTFMPIVILWIWLNSAIAGYKARKQWLEHPETRQQQLNDHSAKVENMPEILQRARRRGRLIGLGIGAMVFTSCFYGTFMKQEARKALHEFATPTNISLTQNDEIDYQLKLEGKSYYVYVPKNYNGKELFGLVVYISPGDDFTQLPSGWSNILDARHLIFIAPQDAGNMTPQATRSGLGVLGALAAMNEYKIDPSRVYAAGLSGGARTAGDMAFYQSDLFTGTIQDCGANFYKAVPHSTGTKWVDSNGFQYGVIEVSPDDVRNAKADVKFTLITGPGDFRHGNLVDLYQGGFHADGFKCKLFDVPNMGHQDCSGVTLGQAIDFLSGK